jgi:hypothetical protein
MFECLNSVVLALDKLILWLTTIWSVLNCWMWFLIFDTLFISFRCISLVIFPNSLIVLIEVESVISHNVREDNRVSFPFMVVLSVLSQSVVAVKTSLEWIRFVVFLGSLSIIKSIEYQEPHPTVQNTPDSGEPEDEFVKC